MKAEIRSGCSQGPARRQEATSEVALFTFLHFIFITSLHWAEENPSTQLKRKLTARTLNPLYFCGI